MKNIQNEAMKIHSKYGISEMANYKLQLLSEEYAEEYHQEKLKLLNLAVVKPRFSEKFEPPFRVGRKRNIAVLDNKGHEVVIFPKGQEAMASDYCIFLNGV